MIFLGIGSNLSSSFGDRFKNIDLAISFLETYKINIIKKSSFYETFSYPKKSNPKFINSVIAVETKLPPVDLMSVLIFVEEKLERKRSKKNDPRTCDLDIIDYNYQIMNFKYRDLELTLPHKEMTNRNFVLYPLREIYPNWIHPLTKKNINFLIKDLKTSNNEITKLS
jgi:2-amino-4-hydroxy-6-hydroxymethyldihydropteridine diphosphokinase